MNARRICICICTSDAYADAPAPQPSHSHCPLRTAATAAQNLRCHTRSHAVTNSCCPSVEPQPLSLKGAHRHTRDSSCGSIGHCPPATIVRPNSPTFRPSGSLALRPFGHRTPRFGWDGPPRRSCSVTARVGDTRGRTERRSGERARAQPGWQRHGGHADVG